MGQSFKHLTSPIKKKEPIYIRVYICFGFFFVQGLQSHSRISHSYGDITIAGEGLQILTCARHSWQLSCEGSLACHTYCDTGHPFIMVISEDPSHSHPGVCQWSCHYLFLRLRSIAAGIRTPNNPLANALAHCATAKFLSRIKV